MNNIYEIKNRLLIPNWRDFKRTTKLGELGDLETPKMKDIDDSIIKLDWFHKKTIGVAADLISNLFISNDLFAPELSEAIIFVEKNHKDSSGPLLALINRIKQETNPQQFEDSNKILERN